MKKIQLNFITFLLLLAFCFLFSGCALQGGSTDISKMTGQQKATFMMGAYNSQFGEYMRMTGYIAKDDGTWEKISNPVLSDDQKKALNKKRDILTQVYPLISLYTTAISTGQTVSLETEQQIFILLDSLVTLVPD